MTRRPACSGTGTVEGLAGRLFAAHPLERVVLAGREPHQKRPHIDEPRLRDGWFWFVCGPFGQGYQHWIPDVYGLMEGDVIKTEFSPRMAIQFPSHKAALDALSAACVRYGRAQAGLGG